MADNDETVSQLSSALSRTGGEGAGIDDVPVWIILVSHNVGLNNLDLIVWIILVSHLD
jgi:hypothetical protein